VKLTVHVFLTLDGVMQSPADPAEDTSNGFDRGGWMNPHLDADFRRIHDGWFSRADAFLLGRSTYDAMHAVWPKVTDPDNRVAAALNGLPKYVVSTTLADPTWQNTTVISTEVIDAVSALKDSPAGNCRSTAAGSSHAPCTTRDWSTNTGCWCSLSLSAPANASSRTVPLPRASTLSTAR
jgi:dihydrofolate reductase